MKRILVTLLFVAAGATALLAQNNTVKGSVVDTTNTPLTSATVMVLQAADSSLVSFGLTDGQGKFEISGVPKGDFKLQLTYIGYAIYQESFSFADNRQTKDFGVIELLSESSLIDEVTVVGERNPVQIKKDTIEFNAGSFNTQPNAVVEDLLKQLPGVEVDRDGGVTAQGEEVQRVLVDGKEFFGRDPKIATKNLPAEAVDKVQVFDQKSDQAQFTGIDDGQREKTINLTLKEDKKKGAFGTITAGAGSSASPESSDGRFVGRASINSFNKNTQLSFIGTGNNINEQGFSLDDYQNFSQGSGGGMRFRRGGGNSNIPINFGNASGIAETYAVGVNFNHEFAEETELNLSYFYSRFDKLTITDRTQQTFLGGDRGFTTNENSIQDDLNANHALNLRFDGEIDSLSSVRVRGTFGYNTTDAYSTLVSSSVQSNGDPGNASDQVNANNGNVLRGNANVLYRRKFKKGGRNFTLNASYGLNNNDFLGNTTSLNTFFTDGSGNFFTDELIQDFDQGNEVDSYSASLSYTEPLGRRRYLEFNYEHSKNQTDVNREVYDISTGERIFDEALSNLYRSGYTYNNVGMNFILNRPTFNLTMGATMQYTNLDGDLLLTDTEIRQDFQNILPQLNFRYNFTSTKNLNVDYETNVIEPSLTQLQPIVDNTNPLNIYVGNPELKPEYQHRIRTRYHAFNPATFSGMFGMLNLTYARNKIRNTQIIDDRLVTTTTPVNVENDYRASIFTAFFSRINALQLKYNIGPRINYSRGITFINGVENNTDNVTTGMRLRFDNLKQEKVQIGIGANANYTTSRFSIDADRNQDFINHTYEADLGIMIKERVNIVSRLDYQVYNGISDDFNQDVPIWNAEVSVLMLKGKKGQLKIGVYDILNQNRGVSRVNQFNYTLDTQVNALGRYFLTTFTYNLKGFSAENNSGRRWRH